MIDAASFLVKKNAPIEDLYRALGNQVSTTYGSGFAILIDEDGIALGTCTDADLRRWHRQNPGEKKFLPEIFMNDFVSVDFREDAASWRSAISRQFGERGWVTEIPARLVVVLEDSRPIGILEIAADDPEMVWLRDRVVVIGLGFVGLTLACALAETGADTHGIETDFVKITSLTAGIDYTKEPGVQALLTRHANRNLFFHSNFGEEISISSGKRNVFVLCVGTPLAASSSVDDSFVREAVDALCEVITRNSLVIIRSTVSVGTSRAIASQIERTKNWQVGRDFFLANSPERTVEGDALREIKRLPQLVGGMTPACTGRAMEFFRRISANVVAMDSPEASELGKLASNAFRDYIFAFSNQLTFHAREHAVDVNQMIEQINSGYSRNSIPQPSPGVGGPCLTKDSKILSMGTPPGSPILAARAWNESFLNGLVDWLDFELTSKSIRKVLGIGLAFKGIPQTPDRRSSTGIEILLGLASKGYSVAGWDAVSESPVEGVESLTDSFEPSGFLLLNNHPSNIQKLQETVSNSRGKSVLIFDPWRLLGKQWFTELSESGVQFSALSLSHKWES